MQATVYNCSSSDRIRINEKTSGKRLVYLFSNIHLSTKSKALGKSRHIAEIKFAEKSFINQNSDRQISANSVE